MLTVGADWVIDDDAASFSEHQLAFQGLASVLYHTLVCCNGLRAKAEVCSAEAVLPQ